MASERNSIELPLKSTENKQTEDSKPMPYLPPEIIVKILLRLSVRTLLRFRYVCKSWHSLVSDTQFVKTHLNMSMKSENSLICFLKSHPKSFALRSISYKPSLNAVDSGIFFHPRSRCEVVGSCNGLVCMATPSDIYLWNPSTRESKRLQGFKLLGRHSVSLAVFGFGYDNSSGDYKVLFCDYSYYYDQVMVHSLRKNCSRRIQGYAHGDLHNPSKYINGALHWQVTPWLQGFRPHMRIVSFDLEREKYGEVPQPDYGGGIKLLSIGVLEECLCIITNNYENSADVWLMKQYGIRESWTKWFTISGVKTPVSMHWYVPLSTSKNGDIVLQLDSELVLYNREDNTFKHPRFPYYELRHGIYSYVESLVSPNACNEIGKSFLAEKI